MAQTINTSLGSASLVASLNAGATTVSVAAGSSTVFSSYGNVSFSTVGGSSVIGFTANQTMADYDLTFNSVTGTAVANRYDLDFSAAGRGIKATLLDSVAGNIAGSAYSDTLVGGLGNDTLTGNGGNDVFSIKGQDIITDYTYGADSLTTALASATLSASGTDVVVNDGSNTATLKNILSDGVAKVAGSDVAVWQSFATSTRTLDASAATSNVILKASSYGDVLIGGTKDDSLVGGIGNDQFWGGAGNDSINASAGGNDIIYWGTGNGNDTVAGFTSNDTINLYNANVADLSFATLTGGTQGLTLGTGSAQTYLALNSTAVGNSTYTITDKTGASQKVTFATVGAAVNASVASDKYISAGNGAIDFSATSVAKVDLNNSQFTKFVSVKGSDTVRDTLVGLNTASSTLVAGALGADMWGGGAQADSMTGVAGASDTFWFGTTDGKDVANGNFGLATDNDVIKLYNTADVTKVSFTASTGVVKLDSSNYISLTGAGLTNSATQGVELKLQNADGNLTKVWYASSMTAGTTGSIAASLAADYYKGGTGTDTLDFSDSSNLDAKYLWLGDTTKYSSIENVKGTANGNDTLIGSAAGSLQSGGAGADVFWGGSNKAQTMIGGTGADTFWFGAGDGKDVISGYAAGNDTINLYSQTGLAGATVTVAKNATNAANTDIQIALNSTDVLTVTDQNSGTAGTVLTLTDKANTTTKAVVAGNGATTLNYVSGASLYYANSNNTTLNVTGSDDTNIFLGNGWGATANSGALYQANKITNIDASGVAGGATVVLAGYAGANNTFTGSTTASVTTQMWGGGSSNDTFYAGGAGTDYIYFGTGDGKDEAKTSGTEDRVVLYADKIADITAAVTGGKLVLSTKAGDTLTIDSWSATTGVNTFQVGTDTTTLYQYDATKKTFVTK